MNVLTINTIYPKGSTGRIASEITSYVVDTHHAKAIAAYGIGEKSNMVVPIRTYRMGSALERKIHAGLRKLLDAEGYGSYVATRKLIHQCKKEKIDIVHMHNLHGCYLHTKLWFRFLEKSRIPVIWTMHDCWPLTGHCAHFTYSQCGKWKTQCNDCPEQFSYPTNVGIDGSRRNYNRKKKMFSSMSRMTMVTPCNWLTEIVQESYLQNMPIRMIPNGVDIKIFKPMPSNIRDTYKLSNTKVVLAVASVWSDRKGLQELYGLSTMLDSDYQLVILGLTKEQIDALPAGILGVESVSSTDELCAWYTVADCFVNPTLEDTMPLVNLEALACGTPIVVYDTGGCKEAVSDDCGRVVSRGDKQGLQQAIAEVCMWGKTAEEACLRRASMFSMEHTLQQYGTLYQEVSQ